MGRSLMRWLDSVQRAFDTKDMLTEQEKVIMHDRSEWSECTNATQPGWPQWKIPRNWSNQQ